MWPRPLKMNSEINSHNNKNILSQKNLQEKNHSRWFFTISPWKMFQIVYPNFAAQQNLHNCTKSIWYRSRNNMEFPICNNSEMCAFPLICTIAFNTKCSNSMFQNLCLFWCCSLTFTNVLFWNGLIYNI